MTVLLKDRRGSKLTIIDVNKCRIYRNTKKFWSEKPSTFEKFMQIHPNWKSICTFFGGKEGTLSKANNFILMYFSSPDPLHVSEKKKGKILERKWSVLMQKT